MLDKIKRISVVINNERNIAYAMKLIKDIVVHNEYSLYMLEWMYQERDLSPVVIDRSIPW